MDHQLTHLAATLATNTKMAARAALKAAGLKQALAEALLAERERLAQARATKHADRIVRRLGYTPVDPHRREYMHGRFGVAAKRDATHGTPARGRGAILPRGTPAERLDALRRRVVGDIVSATYRVATHGATEIILTDDPTLVGCQQSEWQEWGAYSRSCKYPMRHQKTTITVPRAWRIRVERRGLRRLDGMVTIDAAPLDGRGDIELFAATWLVQGRGTSLTAERGIIARCGAVAYHAADVGAAMRGIQQKLRWNRLPEAEREAKIRALRLGDPEALARKYAGLQIEVCISDAQAVGACEYGIRSWCNAVGLDYRAGCAPLAAVLQGYIDRPQPDARAAILHAVRRQQRKVA